jgi:hypothetical protein
LNGDGAVDRADVAVLARHFGAGGATAAQGDLNHDGLVGLADLMLLQSALAEAAGSAPVAADAVVARAGGRIAAATDDSAGQSLSATRPRNTEGKRGALEDAAMQSSARRRAGTPRSRQVAASVTDAVFADAGGWERRRGGRTAARLGRMAARLAG